MINKRPGLPYLVLFGGVLIASTAAIMITGAQQLGASSLTIAAGRLVFASLILTPLAWGRAGGELRRVGKPDLLLALGAGVVLAVHFAAWVSSLAYTSVASSAAFVATNPIWVALASWLVFHERLSRGVWLGVGLTVLGSLLIALSDGGAGGGPNPLLGDALALLGAVCVSGYFLIGRSLRARLSTLAYIWLVYSSAAVILLLWMALDGGSLRGLDVRIYLLLLGLAVGPQLIGHTSFNWAIKYLSATFVTVAILGEPIASALLAIVLLGQPVQPLQLAGGAVLLAGIAVASLAETRTPRQAAALVDAEGAVGP